MYYYITKVEDDISSVYLFLDSYFIVNCLFSSKSSLKETSVSIKKFYQYMSENNYVNVKEYNYRCNLIKENMDEFLEIIDVVEDITFYDIDFDL